MALRLITENNFRQSPYGQMADQIEGRLSDLIERAEGIIEGRLRYVVGAASYTQVFPPKSKRATIFLRHRPVNSVTSIKRRATPSDAWTVLDATTFYLNGGAGYLEDSLGDQTVGYEVEVVYNAGYAIDDVPAAIKQAVIHQTAMLAYQDVDVFGGQDKNPPPVGYINKEIDRLLETVAQTRQV